MLINCSLVHEQWYKFTYQATGVRRETDGACLRSAGVVPRRREIGGTSMRRGDFAEAVAGRNVMGIRKDIVDGHGFAGAYQVLRDFWQ